MLKAAKTDTTYETFEAECPHCAHWNIFNRATDLKQLGVISHASVNCLDEACGREFYINGDQVGPAYRILYFDSYMLRSRKRYGSCIVNLSQSFEVFFHHYLEEELIWKPMLRGLRSCSGDPIADANRIAKLLYTETEKLAAKSLRHVFIWQVLNGESYLAPAAAEAIVRGIGKRITPPDSADISRFPAPKLADLLAKLMKVNLFDLRNSVVHKHAYRPTLVEVDAAFEQCYEVLFGLARALDVEFDSVPSM
jgi:hypothetical protein